MSRLFLFTDCSVDPQRKVGYGAYLVLPEKALILPEPNTEVQVKRFENTSSAQLELCTTIWALEKVLESGQPVVLFTDSQSVTRLKGRRERLERLHYRTAKRTLLQHHALYRAFFTLMDQLDCTIVKVQGHSASSAKSTVDTIFSRVDRASRKALRDDPAIAMENTL